MLKVVIDTNVFVSALLNPLGAPARILDAWKAGKFVLVMSPELATEVVRVLQYPKIREKYGLREHDILDLLILLHHEAFWVSGNPTQVQGTLPEDPEDEKVLATAIAGQADVIVTGDRHLLRLGKFRQIPILTPHQVLRLLEAN